jgi:hypothetical protein
VDVVTFPDGTKLEREGMRQGILQVFDELTNHHKRPPTMSEMLDLLDGTPIHYIRAFLSVAGKRLTDGRALRWPRG